MTNKAIRTFHSMGGFGADAGVDHWLIGAGYKEALAQDADIIVFNGGADIGTQLYNENPIMSRIPFLPSNRDQYEHGIFNRYKGTKFMLGICRGSQFLNVMNGGGLWQDVNNHGRDHAMLDLLSGMEMRTTSTHHQMMRPNFEDGELVAVASESTYHLRDGEDLVIDPKARSGLDIEIMWYPKNRSLCIQGHPEYVPGSHYADYCLGLISRFYKEVPIYEKA